MRKSEQSIYAKRVFIRFMAAISTSENLEPEDLQTASVTDLGER